MIRTIAVTTDFSETSRAAFGAAAALTEKFGAQLHLVHLLPKTQIFMPWQIIDESPEAIEKRRAIAIGKLEQIALKETAFAKIPVKSHVLYGDLDKALGKFEKEEHIDLVVISTHGFSGLKQFPLGGFTAKILQLSDCPVLVIRSLFQDEGGSMVPAQYKVRRILAPHDFSVGSAHALEVARSWAQACGAQARIFSVVEEDPMLHTDPAARGAVDTDRVEKIKSEVRGHLEQMTRKDWGGIQSQTVARFGHPAVEILKEIKEYHPDLVIMASRGLSLRDQHMLGSVAERTIHGSACPVLVVK